MSGWLGSKLRRVRVVRGRIETHMKAQRAVFSLWHIFEPGHGAAFRCIHPCILIGQFRPCAVLALQSETTEKIAEPRHGHGLPCPVLIAHGVEQQRSVVESMPHCNLQNRPANHWDAGNQKQNRDDVMTKWGHRRRPQ